MTTGSGPPWPPPARSKAFPANEIPWAFPPPPPRVARGSAPGRPEQGKAPRDSTPRHGQAFPSRTRQTRSSFRRLGICGRSSEQTGKEAIPIGYASQTLSGSARARTPNRRPPTIPTPCRPSVREAKESRRSARQSRGSGREVGSKGWEPSFNTARVHCDDPAARICDGKCNQTAIASNPNRTACSRLLRSPLCPKSNKVEARNESNPVRRPNRHDSPKPGKARSPCLVARPASPWPYSSSRSALSISV